MHPTIRKPLAAAVAALLAGGSALSAAAPGAAADAAAHPYYALRLARRSLAAHGAPGHAAPRPAGSGAVLPVTSCGDDDDPGTLRNVLAGAAEGDTIDLSALTCSTITLTQGAIDTSVLGDHHLYDVTVQGPGRGALTIDAAGASQVLVMGGFSSDQGTFTLNDVTIANGAYSGSLAACILGFGGTIVLNRVDVTNCHASGSYQIVFGGAIDGNTIELTDSTVTDSTSTGTGTDNTAAGGGIYASGDVTLVRSTVSGNALSAPMAVNDGYYTLGGGLYVRGDLTLTDSTVSGNTIEATTDGENASGGGIYLHGRATITGSTIDGNVADGDGGGLFKAVFSPYGDPPPPQDTYATITNSTISGNTALHGGGIVAQRPVHLHNSTVAFNEGVDGGGGLLFRLAGVYDSTGELDLSSTIIGTNTAGSDAFAADLDADDALAVSGANDLVQAAAAAIALPDGTIAADPGLLPLADNGGPTRTHALAAGSPAIDAGNDADALDFDQRGDGFPRVVGAAADIGAFEAAAADDTIFRDGFDGAP